MDIPTSFTQFVAALQTDEPDPDYIARFVAVHGGTPIVEGNTAHFIAAAEPGSSVGVGGEWNGWDARRGLMQPIGGGLLHYQQQFAVDARLDYLLASVPQDADLSDAAAMQKADVSMSRDPLNPRLGMSGLGDRSALEMPEYCRPAITERRSDQAQGRLVERELGSKALHQRRPYTVYIPPGYDDSVDGSYPAIYFHDGGDYLNFGAASTILDNLIADRTISPLVAVFVPPLDRWAEYDCNDDYLRFFSAELVADVQANFTVFDHPTQRAIMGPSMGGLISLYIAAKRPDVFGKVGAQSSVAQAMDGDWDTRATYADTPQLPLMLHLTIGTYETCYGLDAQGNCKNMLTPVRELRDVLVQYRYPLQYSERHYGHSWALWRDDLADALTFFFAK